MLKGELQNARLELAIARCPEKQAYWADRYGSDLLDAVDDAESDADDRIEALERELRGVEDEKSSALLAVDNVADEIMEVAETIEAKNALAAEKLRGLIKELRSL